MSDLNRAGATGGVVSMSWVVCLTAAVAGALPVSAADNRSTSPTAGEAVDTDRQPSDAEVSEEPAEEGESDSPVVIDGRFEDWQNIPSYTDPANDTHTTGGYWRSRRPRRVEHVDVDLLEYRITHDSEALCFYMRSRGEIGRTQVEEGKKKRAGRYYVIVTIDVDQDDRTGYALRGGGYYPNSRGYDTNAELEFYNGQLNVAKYLNHAVPSRSAMMQAFLDQSSGQFRKGHAGPYPAGFFRLRPNLYRNYTEWVYYDDDTLTFVKDKGPVLGTGIATYALSDDAREIEVRFPFRGFLKDETGKPTIAVGSVLDVSFSLEASGESVPAGRWASDTGEPIQGYEVTPRGE